jgi:hypothetical protein
LRFQHLYTLARGSTRPALRSTFLLLQQQELLWMMAHPDSMKLRTYAGTISQPEARKVG